MTITHPLRKAMIVIAVSEYAGVYRDLPGTLTSAKRVADWARQPGAGREYKVLEITDAQKKPVTVQRLREEIERFLEPQIIDRLVVYFAGHGIVRGVAEQFWLLTNAADDRREGVNMNAFKDGLKRLGIGITHPDLIQGQLCFFVDACRSTDPSALDFVGDPIITRGGISRKLQIDMFFATMLGREAYQPNATATRPAYCLFSDVLCNALEGRVPEVIETKHHRYCPIIDNDLLADYLDTEVPKRAAELNETMEPDNNTRIRRDHNYYDYFSQPPNIEPVPPDHELTASIDIPVSVPDMEPMDVSSEVAEAHARTEEFEQVLKHADSLLWEGNERPLVIEGSNAVAVPKGAHSRVRRHGDQWIFQPADKDHENYPIFAQQPDGWLLVPYFDFTQVIVTTKLPGDVLLHKLTPDGVTPYPSWDISLSSNAALTNKLPPRVSDAERFADELRYGKSQKPNNANIAGYLYDVVGDIDNARRTAHYMVSDAILPLDLALIAAAQLRWVRTDSGTWEVRADLPEVEETTDPQPEGRLRKRPDFTKRAFDARFNVPVRGIMPVFRQGWLKLVHDKGIDMPPLLAELAPTLLGRAAVLLPSRAMEALADLFGYDFITAVDHEKKAAAAESDAEDVEWRSD